MREGRERKATGWEEGVREVRKDRRQNLKSVVVVLFVEVSFSCGFEGIGGLNVTDVRGERVPLLWSWCCFGDDCPVDFISE